MLILNVNTSESYLHKSIKEAAMKETILAAIHAVGPELDRLSRNIYDNPELGYEEFKACAWHTELLEKHGFSIEKNYCDIATAYKATYDSNKPGLTVAFLAEYDALPGVGHGCGHNILGATSLGAGIALKSVLDELGGKVVVFGTPAEETSGAKVIFAEQGKFNDVDIAMMAHPSDANTRSASSLALMPVRFEFFGKPAHAASDPWNGINALDAAIQTINAINALREHMLPSSRMHGVILNGGVAPNVVPEYTKVDYYVRSTTKTYNEELVEKVKNCARAGALATGCRLEITRFEMPYDNLVTNEVLADVFADALMAICGAIVQPAKEDMGSLDAGQVSQCCPTIHAWFDITDGKKGISGHSREFAECTLSEYAKKQMRDVSAALALTGARVCDDPALFQRIRAEFKAAEK